ncbi:MAG TPA: toll/interleukin-1 receptor domain-containing protein [Pyrinomonadaceae bacterium]|nr:toll/interleukin-1 receptor domain-containing protein [Pyrinomonadaceae bacterium]
MRAIFISYRREDAEGHAGRLFDDLVAHFGSDSVFMDVAGLEPGRDFRRAIDQQIASCGVLLALIGKDWLDAKNESDKRRLDDPMDFVRLETASALKRDIPVIPVLVRGADMPRPEDLPDDLKELAYRNAVELTHARWDSDLQVLVRALTPYVQMKSKSIDQNVPPAASTPQKSRAFLPLIIFGGLVLLVVLAVAGYFVFQNSSANRNSGRVTPTVTPTATATATPTATATAKPTREVIQLTAPTLLSPRDGTRFSQFPRTVTLVWDKVPGARYYKVEIQFESNGWATLGAIRNVRSTTLTFDFVGAQPGRWRVWGVGDGGEDGPKSGWWGFYFTQ